MPSVSTLPTTQPANQPAARPAADSVAAAPSAAAPPGHREPFFDNAKFLAIVLVVIGHAVEPLQDVPAARALYLFLYMFHMPLFIVVAGYFSRSFPASRDKARRLVAGVLAPFVVFETAYSAFAWLAGGRAFDISLLDPFFLTWFLVALFAWRLSTPLWLRLRWPLAAAAAISVLAGTTELADEFDMTRILSLLPFFVLGLRLRPENLAMLRRPVVRVLGGFVMLGGLAMAFWADPRMSMEWAYWRRANDYLAVDDLTGSAMRVAMLVSATVLVGAFLALAPRRRTWFTSLGAATLYTYLLHGFVVKLADYLGWYDVPWLHSDLGLLVTSALAVVLAVVLSTPPVRRATRWAVEPSLAWAFRPRRQPA